MGKIILVTGDIQSRKFLLFHLNITNCSWKKDMGKLKNLGNINQQRVSNKLPPFTEKDIEYLFETEIYSESLVALMGYDIRVNEKHYHERVPEQRPIALLYCEPNHRWWFKECLLLKKMSLQ